MSVPLIFLAGEKQHGKTTTARHLSKLTGKPWLDTSEEVFKIFAKRNGLTVERAKELPKEQIRPALIEIGDELCDTDELALCRKGIDEGGVRFVAGIRKKNQAEMIRKDYPNALLVWVFRPEAQTNGVDSLEISRADCDKHITNIEGIGDYYGIVAGFYSSIIHPGGAFAHREPTPNEVGESMAENGM